MPPSELGHVQGVWFAMKPNSPVYSWFLRDIEIVSATKGTVTALMQISSNHINSKGTLHGCVSSCLVDWVGGMAIASHGLEKTGLSTDMHITFISGAKEGDWLQIEGRANKVGASMAFTTATISKLELESGKPGAIVATASHTKYLR